MVKNQCDKSIHKSVTNFVAKFAVTKFVKLLNLSTKILDKYNEIEYNHLL